MPVFQMVLHLLASNDFCNVQGQKFFILFPLDEIFVKFMGHFDNIGDDNR